jgi:hypothetical protein
VNGAQDRPVVDRRTEACHYATGKGAESGGSEIDCRTVSREVMGGS